MSLFQYTVSKNRCPATRLSCGQIKKYVFQNNAGDIKSIRARYYFVYRYIYRNLTGTTR